MWLPVSALLSAAMLHRAHRRRLIRIEGPRPPTAAPTGAGQLACARRGGARHDRARARGAAVRPGGGRHWAPRRLRYSYAKRFTREITGQFLSTPRGSVKLFGWRDPQNPYPPDALRVHARDVRGLVIRSAAVDRPGAYQLFDVDRGTADRPVGRAPLAYVAGSRAAAARCARPLHDRASHEGMFGDRDFIYLTVVAPGGRSRDPDRGRLDPHRSRRCRARCCPIAAALLAAAVHGHAAALVPPPARGREAALGRRLRPVRGGDGLRGGRPGIGLESRPVPRLLPVRRGAHGRLARRGLGLAAAAAARP